MAAYVIAHIAVEDPALWDTYRAQGMPTIAAAGGKLICGGQGVTLEGDEMPTMSAVVEFPTMEAAEAWFRSDVYQQASEIRRAASKTLLFGIVPGVPGGSRA
ncbi:MAG: DUF1330 domain-containing protein [Acidimicrobiia bacterium]